MGRVRRFIRAIALDLYTLEDPIGAGALTSPGGPAAAPGDVSAFGEAVPGSPSQQAASLPARSLLLAGAVALGGPLAYSLLELAGAVA